MQTFTHWLSTPAGSWLYTIGGTVFLVGMAAAVQGSLKMAWVAAPVALILHGSLRPPQSHRR